MYPRVPLTLLGSQGAYFQWGRVMKWEGVHSVGMGVNITGMRAYYAANCCLWK